MLCLVAGWNFGTTARKFAARLLGEYNLQLQGADLHIDSRANVAHESLSSGELSGTGSGPKSAMRFAVTRAQLWEPVTPAGSYFRLVAPRLVAKLRTVQGVLSQALGSAKTSKQKNRRARVYGVW